MTAILYLQSDNLLELKGLKNAASGAYINNATVTATVVDATGAQVSDQSWPVTLSYVAASNGELPGDPGRYLARAENGAYKARVTGLGEGLKRYFEHPLVAQMGT